MIWQREEAFCIGGTDREKDSSSSIKIKKKRKGIHRLGFKPSPVQTLHTRRQLFVVVVVVD